MQSHRVQKEIGLMSISRRSLNECYKFSCETASFFVKINRSFSAREMFEGEAGSLQAMRFAGMNAPAPLKVGDLPHGGSYLIMDHVAFEPDLMLEPSSQAKLGEAIAQMHLHQPERHQFFGFGLPTRLGTVEMENKFCASWAEFFVESRLRRALESVGNKKCHSSILVDRAEEICEKASGMLLEIDESIRPSVLHGDLWYFPPSSLLLSPPLSSSLPSYPFLSTPLLISTSLFHFAGLIHSVDKALPTIFGVACRVGPSLSPSSQPFILESRALLLCESRITNRTDHFQ